MSQPTDVDRVFEAWQQRQARPEFCKLTEGRRRLILRALKDYSAEDVLALIDFAFDSNNPQARYWRGDNRDGRKYLDLTNILAGADRLPGRIEKALIWREDGDDEEADDPEAGEDATEMMRRLTNRAPSGPVFGKGSHE